MSKGVGDHRTTRRAQLEATRRGHQVTRRFRVGAHNLHDAAGIPRFFADVLLFTEALPETIRAKARRAVKVAAARLRGFRVVVCAEQRDLVVAFRRRLVVLERVEYRRAHPGRAPITPHRGTFVVYGRFRFTRIRVAILVEHRINSWWKDERGHREFRADCWHTHAALTLAWIAELEAAGYVVLAGGDLNTPPDVDGYGGQLVEVSTSLDRIGCSSREIRDPDAGVTVTARLGDFDRGPRAGSDHHQISAEATVTAKNRKAAA